MIREGLKALGHYEPTTITRLASTACERTQVLIAVVTPGQPVLITVQSHFTRRRAYAQRLSGLLKTRPAIGTVLNRGDYDNFKSR